MNTVPMPPPAPAEDAQTPTPVEAVGLVARWVARIPARTLSITGRVAVRTFEDGFVHAGNLAYLSIVSLFPFFIVVAAVAGAFGRTGDGLAAVNTFLLTLPPDVAGLLAKPITDVLSQRAGSGLLTFGIIVGVWTTANFVETMRDILRRAYGTVASRAFWQYRLSSMALIVGSVLLMLIAFAFQFVLTAVEQFVTRVIPFADDVIGLIGLSRLAPVVALFVALLLLFTTLTPQKFRKGCPKWPGALLTTGVWIGTTMLLPAVLSLLGGYDLTYGSLAGVIIALLFFFIVGLGFVLGAQLNAALADIPKTRQNGRGTATAQGV